MKLFNASLLPVLSEKFKEVINVVDLEHSPQGSRVFISKIQWVKSLKGQCHEDFAGLGQFCAKIITLGFPHTQNASVKLGRRCQINFIREG